MKKLNYLTIILFFFFGSIGNVNASLVDQGNGIIFDDISELYWYEDLDEFDNMTYSQQKTYIAGLSHASGSWRMADLTDITSLWTYTGQEIANKFNYTRILGSMTFWDGRYDEVAVGETNPSHFETWVSLLDSSYSKQFLSFDPVEDSQASDVLGAWVVSDTNPIPTPSAICLLGSGLIGIVGFRRKFRKS